MNLKKKGTDAERELIHRFWSNGWVAARVAGSGSMPYPSPDIIAAKHPRSIVIESKVTKDDKQYFEKEKIDELRIFARAMNSEAYVAVKFNRVGTYFVSLDDLKDAGKSLVLDVEDAKSRGILFEELIKG